MPSVDKGTGQLELSYITDVNTTVILGKVWQFFFFYIKKNKFYTNTQQFHT